MFAGLRGVAGSLWAAYNGVTEYIDHGGTTRPPDSRLDYIWFGKRAAIKARAFAAAQQIASTLG
jgi:hypothetical protein